MSIEKVRAYLKTKGYDHKIQEFDVSSATVELAAAALHTEGKRIAKTLSFDVKGTPVLVVCAGDAKISNLKQKPKCLLLKKLKKKLDMQLVGFALLQWTQMLRFI